MKREEIVMGNAVSRENRAVSVDGGTKESVTVAEQFASLPLSGASVV